MQITQTAILKDGKVTNVGTRFDSTCFFNDGDYLMYNATGGRSPMTSKFIARFKYCRGNRAGFKAFLVKNFTVEEYFSAREADVAPATILETKGYVSKSVKAILAQRGYPETQEGFRAYIDAQVAKTVALAQSKGHVVKSC